MEAARFERTVRTESSEIFIIYGGARRVGRVDLHYGRFEVHGTLLLEVDLSDDELQQLIDQLDEACQVLKLLWTEPRATFPGRFYQLTAAIAEPKPVQRPHPPIWIGGSGPKRTLRVVAKHAAVWNSNARSVEETRALAKVLADHCAKVGRDPATIRRSHQIRTESADEALRIAQESIREGFSDLLLFPAPNMPLPRGVEKAAELLPRLRALA